VRWDGGNKSNEWIIKKLSKYVDFKTVCPEVEMDLGVPRNTLSLRYIENSRDVRLIDNKTNQDKTKLSEALLDNYEKKIWNIDGAILKSKSPSCGIEGVNYYSKKNIEIGKGPGIFAHEFMTQYPNIPFTHEGRLRNLDIRYRFLISLFTLWRFKNVRTTKSFQNFHEEHKYLIMSYSHEHFTNLGRLVEKSIKETFKEDLSLYRVFLFQIFESNPTKKGLKNVYTSLWDKFREKLNSRENKKMGLLIDNFNKKIKNRTPLNEFLLSLEKKYKQANLRDDYFLHPFPRELLRN